MAPTLTDDSPWTGAFRNLSREHDYESLQVEGTIPKELKGRLFRNGPAIFQLFDHPYPHWFDGDGGITAIRLENGQAWGATRVTKTPGLLRERELGRNLFDGYTAKYSTLFQRLGLFAGKNTAKNTANTSVLFWQKRLLALMEGCPPFEIDPDNLSSLGETTLGGVVSEAFSAHPHRIPGRKAVYNFGLVYGTKTVLELFELPDQGPARMIGKTPLSWPGLVHDFITTDHHLIFFIPPLSFNIFKFVFGKSGISQCFQWKPELGTEIIVVPIEEPAKSYRMITEPFFLWHFCNAFEKGSELVVDFVRYPDFSNSQWLAEIMHGQSSSPVTGQFYRSVIDIKNKKAKFEKLHSENCDFPSVAPEYFCKDYEDAYIGCFATEESRYGVMDCFGKLNMKSGKLTKLALPPGQFPGEPVFSNGHLLSLIYDSFSNRSYLGIANASHLEDGLVAKAWFNHAIPAGFHGIFVQNA